MHVVGIEGMTIDQLKSNHSVKVESICPENPETGKHDIEVTAVPFIQGIANAVGLAMATKQFAASCVVACTAAMQAAVSRLRAVSAEVQGQRARGHY